MNILSKNNWN